MGPRADVRGSEFVVQDSKRLTQPISIKALEKLTACPSAFLFFLYCNTARPDFVSREYAPAATGGKRKLFFGMEVMLALLKYGHFGVSAFGKGAYDLEFAEVILAVVKQNRGSFTFHSVFNHILVVVPVESFNRGCNLPLIPQLLLA